MQGKHPICYTISPAPSSWDFFLSFFIRSLDVLGQKLEVFIYSSILKWYSWSLEASSGYFQPTGLIVQYEGLETRFTWVLWCQGLATKDTPTVLRRLPVCTTKNQHSQNSQKCLSHYSRSLALTKLSFLSIMNWERAWRFFFSIHF